MYQSVDALRKPQRRVGITRIRICWAAGPTGRQEPTGCNKEWKGSFSTRTTVLPIVRGPSGHDVVEKNEDGIGLDF